ncbi:MAG: ComF family protein [Myxococcota bacterium]|nr:ComF family protein [Myxococcota bacterium]
MSGEARTWIHRFKYPGRGLSSLDPRALEVAQFFARTLGQHAGIGEGDWIVPMPLHRRRFRHRGFNPASLIGREIARRTGNPLVTGWLVRTRDTRAQAGLDARARQHNVNEAFACRPGAWDPPERIWLVDDVTTTGATLAAAAHALAAAGGREIIGLCLARTRVGHAPFRK